MSDNSRFLQTFKLVAATLALLFLIGGVLNLVSKRPIPVALTASSATPVETPPLLLTAAAAPTFTAEPPATATATSTARPTFAPTATATTVPPSATPTETATPQPLATPTETATLVPTNTDAPTTAAVPMEAPAVITTALTLTPTLTSTPSGPPTPTLTPTLTPTPVPRTARADDAPDYTLAKPHFWFTRPYSDAQATWGSQFYPYGTNNDGSYLWHHGIDIQNPVGAPILAVGDGQVAFAGSDSQRAIGPQTAFYGQAVIVRHNQTITDTEIYSVYTLYGHVSQVLVQEGESVVAGQPIALTGQEGVALGPHLHLEVRLGENTYLHTQNPDLWMRPDNGYGVIAGRVVDAAGFYVPQQLITLHRAETPDKFWRQTRTYPDHRYRFDPQLGETFTFADVPAGGYVLKTTFDGYNYALPITVTNQALTFVLVEGQPPSPP